jgi:RNA recognition motif-containing protein
MKIHFKYVPGDTTEVEIKQFFAQVGPAYQIRLIGEPGNHRGFGFAKMSATNGALAIGQLDGKEFPGRRIWIEPARLRTDPMEAEGEKLNGGPPVPR